MCYCPSLYSTELMAQAGIVESVRSRQWLRAHGLSINFSFRRDRDFSHSMQAHGLDEMCNRL